MKVVRKHFTTLDSTNTWVKRQVHLLDRDKITLVTAEGQTAGRGRFKRQWESPAGLNVYATFCLFVEKHRTDIGNLPQILALAACQMLQSLRFKAALKWPNDVLLSEKKVAGILCETTPLSDHLAVILGIGLNVNMPLEQLQKIDRPATSLFAEDQQERNVEEMTQLLQNHFLRLLELFLAEGFIPFLQEYRNNQMHRKGDLVRFHDNRVIWEGAFEEIGLDGALNLKMASGEIKTFHAGEIL